MINVTHTLIDGILYMDVQTDLGAQRYAMEISKGQIEFNQTKPMSKAKYKHAMERLSDMAEGKEIEWNDCGEWKKDSEPWLQSVDHMNSPNLIRTKETPTKLPFGPEDIRPGMVFQVVGISGVSWRPPECVENGGVLLFGSWHGWESLMQNFQWSTDAITWHPCEKAGKPSTPPPKREPRRVWVNYATNGEIGNVWVKSISAKASAHDSWCSESAVEFVEVIK